MHAAKSRFGPLFSLSLSFFFSPFFLVGVGAYLFLLISSSDRERRDKAFRLDKKIEGDGRLGIAFFVIRDVQAVARG